MWPCNCVSCGEIFTRFRLGADIGSPAGSQENEFGAAVLKTVGFDASESKTVELRFGCLKSTALKLAVFGERNGDFSPSNVVSWGDVTFDVALLLSAASKTLAGLAGLPSLFVSSFGLVVDSGPRINSDLA